MHFRAQKHLLLFLGFALLLLAATFAGAQVSRQINSSGSSIFTPQPMGAEGIAFPEIDTGIDVDEDEDSVDGFQAGLVNRVIPKPTGAPAANGHAGKKAKSNPVLNTSFDGLNFHDQRFANNGNQFSVEPPDQGLCVGNGFILESANDVVNVYNSSGTSLLGVTDLNSFYKYAPAVVRTPAPAHFGPSITDPSCLFDAATQRWFNVVLTLDRINVDPNTGLSTSQSLTGRNHLDIAVSDTANPLGTWTIYSIPVQDDGTEGTPNHHCPAAGPTPPAGRTHPNACLGDYPHIGADANGFYITTNEFNFFPAGYQGSQIYAMSKQSLVSGGPVQVFQYDTSVNGTTIAGLPGFTVWPAQSPDTNFATEANGTEYFLSSLNVFTASDNRLGLWALTNTAALNSNSAPTLQNAVLPSIAYADPPRVSQPGSGTNNPALDWPVGQCIMVAQCDLFLNGLNLAVPEVIGRLNANDARMQQVMFANGKVWGALGTGIVTDGDPTVRGGVAFFVVKPQVSATTLGGKFAQQGYVAVDGASLTYPTTAVLNNGRGVISFTVVGPTLFPSSGFIGVDALIGAGSTVQIARQGLGLQDGFTEYTNIFGGRPRWGDYGAAATDGNSIWFASEYIGQSCNLTTYEAGFGPQFGLCGGTRGALGNWGTRISNVVP